MSSRNRGEVWLANLNPGKGTEPGNSRPVLIVQSQALLDAGHPSTLVLPLTTNLVENCEPLRVRIRRQEHIAKESDVLVDQLRALDNRRFGDGPIMTCSPDLLHKIDDCMRQVLDLESV